MPDRVIDAPIADSRADRLNRYLLDPNDHLLDKSPYGDLVMFTEAAAAIRVLEGKLARLEAEKQEAHTEGWNAGREDAARHMDDLHKKPNFIQTAGFFAKSIRSTPRCPTSRDSQAG